MHFLKSTKYAFATFALFGIMDILSTMILVRHHGIVVETNPLIRFAYAYMSFYCFVPHLLLVLLAAYFLSRPTWNDPRRFAVKSALFYVYVFIMINNWWQVAQIGVELLTRAKTA